MGILRVVMHGHVTDGHVDASPVVEEWSAGFSLVTTSGFDPTTFYGTWKTAVQTWFQAADSKISQTCRLEGIKINGWDPVTGKQITDPTHEEVFSVITRGGGGYTPPYPLGTSYRVSIDNGTRNRRARGGFFVPRTTMAIGENGRFDPTLAAAAATTAQSMLNAFKVTGCSVGVYSRAEKGIFAATRLRVGDVPDNISRRRDALRENYALRTIN